MTEKDVEEQRWLQQLITYAHEHYMDRIGETNWNDFLRDYGNMEIWREAFECGETPQDSLDSEISYWEI